LLAEPFFCFLWNALLFFFNADVYQVLDISVQKSDVR